MNAAAAALDPARRAALGRLLALAGAMLPAVPRAAQDAMLARIDDLRTLAAQVEREKMPLLLFFSLPGCPYCHEVRRGYLAPRAAIGVAAGVIVREVDITSTRRFVGLDGTPVSEAEFATRLGARFTPVVLLVDARMRPLADPLVGIVSASFYEAYLQGAIDTATRRLGGRP